MTLKTEALTKTFSEMNTDVLMSKWTKGNLVDWAEDALRDELLARGVSRIKLDFIKNKIRVSSTSSTENYRQETTFRDITRYLLASIVYVLALLGQLFLIVRLVPISISGKDFDDFMLLSMGLLFVPLIIVLLFLCFIFLVINFIAYFFAKVCLRIFPKK